MPSLLGLSGSLILAALAMDLKADIIFCFGAFLGIAFCLESLNLRSCILSLLIPAMLFFSLKINCARHLMAPYSVLTFLAAVAFVSMIKNMRWGVPIIAVLLLLNYFTSLILI